MTARTLIIPTAFALLAAACAGVEAEQEPFAGLEKGMWVEVEGTPGLGSLTAEKIEQVHRSPSDGPDKFEVRGPVDTDLEGSTLSILDTELLVDNRTTYQDRDKNEVDPFAVHAGDWLKVKARLMDEGGARARVLRADEFHRQFRITGEVHELDLTLGTLQVGGVALRLGRQTRWDLQLGEDLQGEGPLGLFLADEQKSVPFTIRLSDRLLAGGEITLSGEHREEFDLRDDRNRDRDILEEGAKLDLLWQLDNEGSFVLVEGSWTHEDEFRQEEPDTSSVRRRLSRAYGYFKLNDSLRLQVGRQDFDEEREWLYDELLDGVRVHAATGPWELELSASTGREFADEEGNPTEDTSTYMALLRHHFDDHFRVTAYVINREDSSVADFEPLHVGVRSYDRPGRGLGHWLELSQAYGRDGTKDIDGQAMDGGLMYRFKHPLRPTVYGGYAFGSGRRPTDDRVGFRQTGLQDNNGKFGGVTSFKYYGELFEPELSNMEITTFGVGVRPDSSWSIDLVYHTYRQDFAADQLARSNLRAPPNGLFRNLGTELDLVFGYRWSNRVRFELIVAGFDPGNAFDRTDEAFFAAFQVRYKF